MIDFDSCYLWKNRLRISLGCESGIRMINSLLFLILTDLQCFQQTQKELHKIYPGILEQTKPLQLVGYYG